MREVLERLITSSNFEGSVDLERVKIKILFDDNIALFFNRDNHFYITTRALKATDNHPAKIGLLISHELAHYLLDHQEHRIMNAVLLPLMLPSVRGKDMDLEMYDPLREELKKRRSLQVYSCFYQGQRMADKYFERHCDSLGVQLWKQAFGPLYSDEDLVKVIDDMY